MKFPDDFSISETVAQRNESEGGTANQPANENQQPITSAVETQVSPQPYVEMYATPRNTMTFLLGPNSQLVINKANEAQADPNEKIAEDADRISKNITQQTEPAPNNTDAVHQRKEQVNCIDTRIQQTKYERGLQ